MKQQVVVRPARLLFLVPIALLATAIDDPFLSLVYVFSMGMVTGKFFPISELVDVKEDKKSD